ncbi:SCO4225 family membrane protein [Streptomyces sp. NPDC054840]
MGSAGYLTLMVGLLVWVDVLVRTGDAGFAGIWPMLATAPHPGCTAGGGQPLGAARSPCRPPRRPRSPWIGFPDDHTRRPQLRRAAARPAGRRAADARSR